MSVWNKMKKIWAKMKSKMKWSNLWFACLLFACVVSLSVESPAAANPKRKSKNLLAEAGDNTNSDVHHGDLIPIPDNLLKKPVPKKVPGKK